MAANRVGKTEGGGGYETVRHLTGEYPNWWDGYEFDHPIDSWVGGDTKETVRDITQFKLFGPIEAIGTGLIPRANIGKITWRPNSNGAIDIALIKHKTGKWSKLGFKSYDQGRESFQGTEKDLIWLDEEAPENIRNECILRLMTTKGHLIETFTPLRGITKVVQLYRGEGALTEDNGVIINKTRAMVSAGWDDVPHLSEEDKARMLAETPPHLVVARSTGVPSLGSGAIYTTPLEDFVINDIEIPAYWPRLYALDVGWNKTAALWAAHDKPTDTIYLYAEYYRGKAEPAIHAAAVNAKGKWIPGEIDPAADGSNQKDGSKLMKIYQDLGLTLRKADNSVEAGILDVWQRLSTGRLKVFKSLQHWIAEYQMYRRDENGKIVKENDHLMDDTRYVVRGIEHAVIETTLDDKFSGFVPLDPGMGY